jgi:uncharacterized membrane protein YphA (DoxX/SURF4 family)
VIRLRPVVYHLCRLALGALFVYAGAVKADDLTAFAGSIAAYEILPYFGNYLVAATLPYIEVLAGLLLLANRRVRPAALLLAGLTLVFMAVLLSVIARGLEIDCGCFGADGRTTPAMALLRDAGILVLAHFTFHLRAPRP